MNTPRAEDNQMLTAPMYERVLELMDSGMMLGDIFQYTDEDYEAVYALGHNLYAQQRYLDAMKSFGFLVTHNQYERRFMSAFASSLQMLKMYEDAVQFHSMASVMDLSDPKPTFHTAECMIALRMYAEARQALDLVIEQSRDEKHATLLQRAQALRELLIESHLGDGERPMVDASALFPLPASSAN